MYRSFGISIVLTIIMILSSFTVVGETNKPYDKCEFHANELDCDLSSFHPINVTKKVWDSDIGQWIDYYDAELYETGLFNITITYHKNCLFGDSAEKIQVIDSLPSGLSFIGSTIYNVSFINGSQIFWNLSEDYGIILYDDESASIEFEAKVSKYGEHENYVEVFAFETGCEWDLYGDSDAIVNGVPPDPSFIKKVKDTETGEWVDDTFQYVTETVTFKIELIYYGAYNLTDVKIVDYFPKVTYYANEASIEPTYISGDGSIIWWNLSEPVEGDEPLVIIYDAYAWGRTGDCPSCGINLAKYNAIENVTFKAHQGDDTATITTDFYNDPDLSYSPNNINFGEQNQGWTGSSAFEIWNSGQQTLTYTISESLDWIEVSPTSGTSEGEHDIVTVNVKDTSDMSGYYSGNIDISSNGGSGSVFVSIYIHKEEPTEPGLKVTIKGGLGRSIKVNVENTGNADINNITWNITVDRRGLIKKTLLDKNETISSLQVGSTETITERLFGFGLITVNVNVNAPGIGSFETTAKGFIILRFVRLRRLL